MVRRNLHIAICFLLLLLSCSTPVFAQYYFGKNKVQYTQFDWRVMTTRHFKIYFYSGEDNLAEIAAQSAEESYRGLAAKFNHEIYSKIPLIIYCNPNHFVQTNVTFAMLPENVAGFTEYLKGRVVVPYEGSYHDFDRVIRHELVHVFTISKINRTGREYSRASTVYPPLWFIEGIAEFWSRDWGSDGDLIIRDMVINGTLPSIENMWSLQGTYYMYKLGESICNFISDNYGEDKLTRLFDNWEVGRTFDANIAFTLGDGLSELSRKWHYHLKKKYFPQIAALDLPDQKSSRLTNRQFAVRPVPVTLENDEGNDEQWVIYKSNKVGYSAIYMIPADADKDDLVTLVKGDRSSRFESLHLLKSGVDQYDNKLLAFSSKSKERDVLYIYDLENRSIITKYVFDSLVSMASPRFSPDGKRVVFSGSDRSGYTDLYLLNLESGGLKRLTDDIYNDLDPCFSHDGKSIVFSSDRGADGFEGYLALFKLGLVDDRMEMLTWGSYHDRGAAVAPDGSRIIFSSDRGEESAYNIFALDSAGNMQQLTEYITGAFDPRFGSNPEEIYFSAYQNLGFHVFKTSILDTIPIVAEAPPIVKGRWMPGRIDAASQSTTIKYSNDYSLDIAQSSIAYDDVYGTIGGLQAAVSDMLGNNMIIFLLSNSARNKDEFLTSFNVALTYLRRTGRINWGIGGFHLYDQYYNTFDGYYWERLIGGVIHASYPISKFDRIEASTFIRHSNKEVIRGFLGRKAFPVTQLLSFVTDNTLWEATGPLEGRRINLTVGLSYDFMENENYNRLASADIRHYLRVGQFSSIASRLFGFTSDGREPQRIYLGGSWSFRGYSRRQFYNRNIIFNSEELRFPLINDLILNFPIGNIQFRGIRGAFFHDMGTAWDDKWNGWLGSFGASVRIALGYLVVLRFDVSRTHDFIKISERWRGDFFFGWNF
jgi:Tol biopolymer transport system component